MDRDELIATLKEFKNRRDDVLFEDDAAFHHHLGRLVEFVENNAIVNGIVGEHFVLPEEHLASWWEASRRGDVEFPREGPREQGVRLQLAREAAADARKLHEPLMLVGKRDRSDRFNFFRSVVIGPLCRELSDHLSQIAGIVGPEARALQAVPLHRIPSGAEVRIFLSHKSVDKPIVYRFYHALGELGFAPWLDEPDMPAGVDLERSVLRGFEESCAAVFFITENFKDESHLAAEVEYAVEQKRLKGDRFSIITLRFAGSVEVPGLLTPFIYKDVSNELDAFREMIRALPIELGPVRWKQDVSTS